MHGPVFVEKTVVVDSQFFGGCPVSSFYLLSCHTFVFYVSDIFDGTSTSLSISNLFYIDISLYDLFIFEIIQIYCIFVQKDSEYKK